MTKDKIRKAKQQTRNARKRKKNENFSNADRLNPKIWEAKIKNMRLTKFMFRDAKWNKQYAEAKRMLGLSYKAISKKANI